jgi:hypothetical protein
MLHLVVWNLRANCSIVKRTNFFVGIPPTYAEEADKGTKITFT